MKSFMRALPMSLLPTIFIILSAVVIQFILYGSEHFEAFFGVVVGKFNLLKYSIAFIILWIIFALIFRSDYE